MLTGMQVSTQRSRWLSMKIQGTVQNCVVVLEANAQLPNGTHVTVLPDAVPTSGVHAEDDALFRMSELSVETGVRDLATNADHYLYGHPKASRAH